MRKHLTKKYGYFTAVSLVVGLVIGSGVFFNGQNILKVTGGDVLLSAASWAVGGVIMLSCILAFSGMARKFEGMGGVQDYAEKTVGEGYGYAAGWFGAVMYYPMMAAVTAWMSARYTLLFISSCFGTEKMSIDEISESPQCMALMLFYICVLFMLNVLSPRVSGKLQIATTVLKLIPLALMAGVGLLLGILGPNHMLSDNLAVRAADSGIDPVSALLTAVCITAFAYEGWAAATISSPELEDKDVNMPKALLCGGVIVVLVYLGYWFGLAGGADTDTLIRQGTSRAFVKTFGSVFGNVLNLFIAVSCLGAANGMMFAASRSMYGIAVRGRGPMPAVFSELGSKTGMPVYSAVAGLFLTGFWGSFFLLTNQSTSGGYLFDMAGLPVITVYAFYIPILVMWTVRGRGEPFRKRFVYPFFALAASCFMIYASILTYGGELWEYLGIFAAVMLIGFLFYRGSQKKD